MTPAWTEGARRAIEHAEKFAIARTAPAVAPEDLLLALATDETRACEILASFSITENDVREFFPHDTATAEATSHDHETTGDAAERVRSPDHPVPPTTLPPSETFRAVLAEAARHASLAGRQLETGSEHLLWGLLTADSPVATWLGARGMQMENLAERVREASGHEHEPLDIDFHLATHDATESERTDIFRILDAAANRLREGLRVLEDHVRFAGDNAELARLLKERRHAFADAMSLIDPQGLLAARETRQDVGTRISTPAEQRRQSTRQVLQAACKRTQEAARSLEEFGKILSAEFATRIEQLRYSLYTLERVLLIHESSRTRFAGHLLYLLLTEAACPRGSGPMLQEALAGGVSLVQVREKSMTDRRLLEHCRRVREWTREAGALFVVNDRPDIAVLADADGVHVGQDELSVREARRIVGPRRLIGVSTHNIEQARQAVLDGADYLGVGPVFSSRTKSFSEFAGLDYVRQVAAEISLPWFAIGGIGPENVEQVIQGGATRIAVSQSICGATDPTATARQLQQRLAQGHPT